MLDPTRVIFVGHHAFSIRAFEGVLSSPALLERRINVPLVIGMARRSRGTLGSQSCAELAAMHNIEHVVTDDGSLSTLTQVIRGYRPHYIMVVGWSWLVSAKVLAITDNSGQPGTMGCIGMHPTLLPEGRGQAPIPWTIIKGLTESGLTVFFLEEGVDSGPIIARYRLGVYKRETAASLFYRFANLHFLAGLNLASGLADRQIEARTQDPPLATKWPRRRPCDGEITESMTVREIDALVRAQMGPYPRAFVYRDGRRYEVVDVEVVGELEGRGRLSSNLHRIRFKGSDGLVDLLSIPA